MGPGTSELDQRRIKESCMVRRIFFLVHHIDGRVRIRQFPTETLAPECTVGRRKAGGDGIMGWAIFSWSTLGPLIAIEQSLTSVLYLNIVADQVHPFMTTVFLASDGVYQPDNAP